MPLPPELPPLEPAIFDWSVPLAFFRYARSDVVLSQTCVVFAQYRFVDVFVPDPVYSVIDTPAPIFRPDLNAYVFFVPASLMVQLDKIFATEQ